MTSPYITDTPVLSLEERREKLYRDLLHAEAQERMAIATGLDTQGFWGEAVADLRADLANLSED